MFYKTLFDADSENHIPEDLGRRGGPYRSLISVEVSRKSSTLPKNFFFFLSFHGRNQTVDSNPCFIKYFLMLIPKIMSPGT